MAFKPEYYIFKEQKNKYKFRRQSLFGDMNLNVFIASNLMIKVMEVSKVTKIQCSHRYLKLDVRVVRIENRDTN